MVTIYKTDDGCQFDSIEKAEQHEKEVAERVAKAKARKEKEQRDYNEIKAMYETLCDMIDSYTETYGGRRLWTLF